MPPFMGGVHKLLIVPGDLVKDILQNIFGEEMGGSGGPRPPYRKPMKSKENRKENLRS